MDAGDLSVEDAWARCTQKGVLLFEGLEEPTAAAITIESRPPRREVEMSQDDAEGWAQAVERSTHFENQKPVQRASAADLAVNMARSWIVDFESRREGIDKAITGASKRWKLTRMAVIDRNILRLGTFEILSGVTPPRDAIYDCVELAKRYGDVPTPNFINGILDQLCREQGIEL
jgi:transcription antitermination factor NusB